MSPPPLRAALLTAVALVGLAAAGVAANAASAPGLRAPKTVAVDLLPLWLGAGAVLDGEDPLDPVAAEARFAAEGLPGRPGGFYSYYPPTAAVLALPLRTFDFRGAVDVARAAAAVATGLGVAAAVFAGFAARPAPDRWLRAAATVGGIVAVAVLARPARVVLPTAQPGPFVVLATGLALAALGAGRPRFAAAVAALGTGLKLVPAVLVPVWALRRQPGALAVFGGVIAALVAVLAGFGVPLHPWEWATSVVGFFGRGPLPSWSREPTWLQTLHAVRAPLVGLGTLGLGGLAWRRGLDDARGLDLAALAVAAVGVLAAGSHHYHEALVLLPALAHALAWPAQSPRDPLAWLGALALLAVGAAFPAAFHASGRPDALDWVAIGTAGWGVCAARVARREAPGR